MGFEAGWDLFCNHSVSLPHHASCCYDISRYMYACTHMRKRSRDTDESFDLESPVHLRYYREQLQWWADDVFFFLILVCNNVVKTVVIHRHSHDEVEVTQTLKTVKVCRSSSITCMAVAALHKHMQMLLRQLKVRKFWCISARIRLTGTSRKFVQISSSVIMLVLNHADFLRVLFEMHV